MFLLHIQKGTTLFIVFHVPVTDLSCRFLSVPIQTRGVYLYSFFVVATLEVNGGDTRLSVAFLYCFYMLCLLVVASG